MTDATQSGKTITIDGKEYELSNLSESARAQVGNLQVTDSEIKRLQAQLSIFKTARQAYATALKDELARSESH